MKKGTLVFFTGKMGAGKTTLARTLSNKPNSIYLSEDDILSTCYPNDIRNIDDYVLYSKRIKPFITHLVTSLTSNGLTVVLDFPGNTRKQRAWFKELIQICDADSKLIYLKVDDEICIQQLGKRSKEEPERHRFDTEEMFHRITTFFQEPTTDEGFHIEIIERIAS